MALLRRIDVEWTTGPGGRGLSVFYTLAADDVTTNLGTFFNAIKGLFPSVVTWAIPSSGDEFDATTGVLTGGWAGGTAANLAGTTASNYAAGTGCYISWRTGTVRAGRRFQGRTFLVPILSSLYDTNGTIDNTNLAALQTATNTLVAANKLVLWGRPTTPGGNDGMSAPITSGTAQDKVTSLRTRRS